MNLTEAEAREKYCPVAADGNVSLRAAWSGRSPCQASECMAWRWAGKAPPKPDEQLECPYDWDTAAEYEAAQKIEPLRPEKVPASWIWEPIVDHPDGYEGGAWVEPEAEIEARHAAALAVRQGYCGFALRPPPPEAQP